jgi:hypothetical protein
VTSSAFSKVSSSDKNRLIAACTKEGELLGVCKCVADKLTAGLNESEIASAKDIINMIANNQPPKPSKMAQYQGLLAKYSQIGMQCAGADNSEYTQDSEASLDISAMLPKGSLSDEQSAALNRMINAENQNDISKEIQIVSGGFANA